jgi:hypothetical protein
MPLFKVSAGSEIPVSAVVTSHARTMEAALEEVRGLQARARINWSRAGKPIGAIEAPYEIWAVQEKDGSFTVSLTAVIPIIAQQVVIAEDPEAVQNAVSDRQTSGLIQWLYRGVPIGEYREEIPTFWSNQQPELQTASVLSLSQVSLFPGQSVMLSADVSASETPSGNVEFVDTTAGGFGTIALTPLEKDAVTHGLAHASAVVVMPEGVYNVRANYLGSDGFQPAQSLVTALSVAKVSTSVVVTPPTPPLFAGQSFSLGVQINHAVPAAPAPTGVITLFQGSTVLASKQVVPSSTFSNESFGLGTLAPGTYSFTVQYDGDSIHQGSSAVVSGITVQQATTTAVLSVLNPSSGAALTTSVFSQPVRLRAVVTSVVDGTRPTGTVTFKRGGVTIATTSLIPDTSTSNQSRAEVLVSNLSVTTHSLTAEYGGGASFAAATSPAVSFTVNKASVSVVATSANSPTRFGAATQFTASVVPVSPATVSPFQQYGTAGSVSYKDTATAVVNFNSSGQATRSISNLAVGANEVGVTFVATAEFNQGFNSFLHVVNKADTVTTLASNQAPVSYWMTFRLLSTVASVSPGVGIPTGTVSFSVLDPYFFGDLFLGSANLVNGACEITTSFFALVTDTYQFKATYSGSANQNPSVQTFNLQVFGFFF